MIDGPRAALPDSKTGPRALWLGRAARRHLAGCPRLGRHVFGDRAGPLPAQRLAGAWQQVRTALGMPRLRIHDLRHSFASVAAGRGHDLTAIGGLLGHADRGVTAGYAHLDTATLRAASARVGRHLERAMQRAPQAPPAREGTTDAAYRAFGLSPLTLPNAARCTASTRDIPARPAALAGGAQGQGGGAMKTEALLTPHMIAALRPKAKEYTLHDAGCPGLALRVQPSARAAGSPGRARAAAQGASPWVR
ncbi:MAG: tyrosine-type recombinase/integrase [Rhodobacteraceae bacterium]|nr:tyrosine-type recombinase/integrase [Paracoccaceae bacterium]